MQKETRVTGCIGLALFIFFLMAGTSATATATDARTYTRLPAMVGLAVDSRCNLYTASKHTGYVFCIPPSSSPVLIGKVSGTPTAVAVDRLRTVFVSTEGGRIFCISLDGDVREVCRISARPIGLAIDRDGGLVLATDDGELITVGRDSFAQ